MRIDWFELVFRGAIPVLAMVWLYALALPTWRRQKKTLAELDATLAGIRRVKAAPSQKCAGGCHVHWSGWPASHHPNCTVNGNDKHG